MIIVISTVALYGTCRWIRSLFPPKDSKKRAKALHQTPSGCRCNLYHLEKLRHNLNNLGVNSCLEFRCVFSS